MTIQEFVARLDGVKQSGRGIMARCPAHDDRNPSLSVREGDRALLIRCWAGCATADIVAAMGLQLSDLFYDAGQPRQARLRRPAIPRINLNHLAFRLRFHGDLLFLRSRAVLDAAKDFNIATWTDGQLERALGAVATAHNDLDRAALFDDLAFTVRGRLLGKEQSRAA